ncbi:hypothetical protein B0H17DRAFT_1085522 [Mycena rosella]|uniref:ABM domain-containing protein n=1 Tax=Mycena rosella TaxID=1033263 RepID=A0AAD7CZ13_MYCRO|nr:hypothetical protein B0H17DRAFT_1085522 [Mycena rosella]
MMFEAEVPYYAVIFSSKRKAQEGDGYPEMAAQMVSLAQTQPGFLGIESVSSAGEDGGDSSGKVITGITISYWKDESSIKAWKSNLDHLLAQKKGKNDWYTHYEVRVSRVERAYEGGFESKADVTA